jgi:8-oxo-dGTP pyrophosphatase MutT (NUDIX family)
MIGDPGVATPELSTYKEIRMLENEYCSRLELKRHLEHDKRARELNDERVRILRGQLYRHFVEQGKRDLQADDAVRWVGERIRQPEWSEQTMQDWWTPVDRASAHIVVRNRNGDFLIQLRSKDAPTSPGMSSIPGGKLQPGETPEQCALRELKEETGLGPDMLIDGCLTPHGSYLDPKENGELVRRFFFYTETPATDQDVICGEGDEMRFRSPEEIPGLDLTEEAAVGLAGHLATPFTSSPETPALRGN